MHTGTLWAALISANGNLATLFLAPKFCMNSLLSSLNSRKELRSLADITLELGESLPVGSRVCDSDQPQQSEVRAAFCTHRAPAEPIRRCLTFVV